MRAAPAQCVEGLLAAASARGADRFALLAQGEDCSVAFLAALAAPDKVEMLVLLSPAALDAGGAPVEAALAGRLGEVKAQTLALFGTRSTSAPPAMGGHYKRVLPACHLIYVFDAADTSCERLEAVSEVTGDFLRRRRFSSATRTGACMRERGTAIVGRSQMH